LYTYDKEDHIVSCNACGASTTRGHERFITHYASCGGKAEIERWNKYYSSPEWRKAVEEDK
ncbi:MAG: hypothetical protein ACXABY_30990, partial [Candidatus Thorarchaeota archaeon]